MGRHSVITEGNVLQAVRLFRWVSRSTLVLYFEGVDMRSKAFEILLPELEREGKLCVAWHRGEKVYSIPRKNRGKAVSLDHEVVCADILVRLWRCRMEEGEIFTERAFRGFRIVPEGGIRYSEERKTMLIFEYCTRSNFTHGGVMKSKITRYRKHLPAMEAKVNRNITVLFVIDIDRGRLRQFINKMRQILAKPVTSAFTDEWRCPFLFTDYETFKTVPVGQALTARIYLWHDGKEWGLSHDD